MLALTADGYRPARERAHERAILSLKFTLGTDAKTVDLVDAVRRKRNLINYERAGTTAAAEADEFYEVAVVLRADVVRWLRKKHRALCPPGITP